MSPLPEGGLRNHRTEFVPETTIAEPPTDPAWELFSDRLQRFVPSIGPQFDQTRKVGDADVQANDRGPEDDELTVAYLLQRWLVDGSGDAQDAAGYGLLRDGDNFLPATHTIVDRESKSTGGEAGGGLRIYRVALGAYINSVTIPGDADRGSPIEVELGYTARKIRSYALSQPSAGTTLDIVSTDASDTMDVTIEDDGAATSETNSLNGTTTVTTTSSFSSIDAVWLSEEPTGNVTVSDGSGNTLLTIYGSSEYDDVEGDRGIPLLGSGSHASAIGTSFEKFLGHQVQRGGSAMADVLSSVSLEVTNELATPAQVGSLQRAIEVGNREVTIQANTHGTQESHDRMIESLRAVGADIVWTFSGGTLTVKDAVLTDPGEKTVEVGQAIMQEDNTFTGEGSPAIVIA